MTREEYRKRAEEIREEYNNKMIALNTQTQIDNNTYKVGDVIEDGFGKGRIKEIIINRNLSGVFDDRFYYLLPSYLCDNITRKGEINKREPIRVIYGFNITIRGKGIKTRK